MVHGPVTVQPGGLFTPGVAGVGRLHCGSSLTLNGTTGMEISRAGGQTTNDQVSVAGPVTFGGQLVVTHIGPDPLQAGDAFLLFAATRRAGSFTNIVLPPLPYGLAWTNRLAKDGSLAVISAANPTPVPLEAQVTQGQLILSWPADHIGWRLEAQTNGVEVGLWTNWFTWPGSASTNTITLPVNSGCSFFRLVYP